MQKLAPTNPDNNTHDKDKPVERVEARDQLFTPQRDAPPYHILKQVAELLACELR